MSHQIMHSATTWTSAGLAFVTALVYFAGAKPVIANFRSLGYPMYMIYILGIWKFLGAVALVAPVFPVVREWAYAGFTFDYTGAFVSHCICREFTKSIPSIVVLALLAISYFTGPAFSGF